MLPYNTKIGILAPVTWEIPPVAYGPWEKVVTNVARGLVEAGYTNVTLFATKEAKIKGTKTVALLKSPLKELQPETDRSKEYLHITSSLAYANEHCDIVHNNLNFHPLLFSSFLKVPIVTTLHGSASVPESKIAYEYFKNLPYVSISDAERAYAPKLNYVATVYNPIDFSEFSFNPKAPDKKLVFAGRIHPDKGVHNAIALAQRTSLPLIIAGPIPHGQETYFKEQVEPHIDKKQITFVGNLTPKKVHALVSGAMAFVGLIEWDEPFGLSIAEAMASGTPVIGTPRGSQKELIIDGVTGILVKNVEEAARRIGELEHIERARCRAAASEMFDIKTVVNQYLQVYETVLSSHD